MQENQNELTLQEQATNYKTMLHIAEVRRFLKACAIELLIRGEDHDASKLEQPEVGIFTEFTPKLAATTYGTEEYYDMLAEMQQGLIHHYEVNSHHPQHHDDGVNDMCLFDVIEMLCDWGAAVMRHDDGDIFESLFINKERFNISDQLFCILFNTAIQLFHKPTKEQCSAYQQVKDRLR